MSKRIFLSVISLLSVLIALAGCSSTSNGSYAGILSVNEKKYIWQGEMEDDEFTLGKKIGEVLKKVNPEVVPKGDFSSNFLEVGEEIYSSNEDSRVLIIKRKSGSLEKMSEEDYYQKE
jgi:hypothetical protein